MFIQTESTPNPATLKFLPGCQILEKGSANFANPEAARRSPLAERLFQTEGVANIFLGSDFITVTKTDEKDWDVLKPLILGAVMEHFTAGNPVMTETGEKSDNDSGSGSAVEAQIKELLDTRVRPAVAQDGGDIVFREYKNGIVYLEMYGACSGCPSSSITLKNGIENLLKHYIPEIVEVRSVQE
ncbi:MAG TPA: NifU family protein [Rhodospirillales bacterium]|jgi:Fe-S cluster biogenesis protein NfuA|nr:NifU family protein [Rhodospirillales bacterium]